MATWEDAHAFQTALILFTNAPVQRPKHFPRRPCLLALMLWENKLHATLGSDTPYSNSNTLPPKTHPEKPRFASATPPEKTAAAEMASRSVSPRQLSTCLGTGLTQRPPEASEATSCTSKGN